MIRNLLLIVFYLNAFVTATAQNLSAAEEADQLLEKMVSEMNIVGVTAGYSVEGNVKWKNARGYSSLEEKIPFTDSTLTRMASIAKSMTAIAVMQLTEKGLIDLDQPVQKYIPHFPKKEKGEITVRHLLSHTSGLAGYQSEKEAENTTEYPTLEEALNIFKDRELMFEPGTGFFYTTYGYVVLGRIIEMVAGMAFEEYMQKNIWDKAGMTNTGIERMNSDYNNQSRFYHKNKKKSKLAATNNLSNRIPGGGFYTTLNDLIKFGNAIVDNALITEETFNRMTENQFKQKEGNPYGLGWFFYGPPPYENIVIGHSGEQTGAATQLMIIPKSKTVVAVLANTSGTWKDVVTLASNLIGISELNQK